MMAKKLKAGLGLAGFGLAVKAGFLKILGLLVLQDYFTLQLGAQKGFTVVNFLIAVGVSLVVLHLVDKKR